VTSACTLFLLRCGHSYDAYGGSRRRESDKEKEAKREAHEEERSKAFSSMAQTSQAILAVFAARAAPAAPAAMGGGVGAGMAGAGAGMGLAMAAAAAVPPKQPITQVYGSLEAFLASPLVAAKEAHGVLKELDYQLWQLPETPADELCPPLPRGTAKRIASVAGRYAAL
jgi:hypothetical protein